MTRFGLLAALCALVAPQPTYAGLFSSTVGLDGLQEVPPNASSGGGSVHVELDGPTGNLTVSGDYHDLAGDVTGAHLHHGLPGATGPDLVTQTAGGGAAGTLTGGSTLSSLNIVELRPGSKSGTLG